MSEADDHRLGTFLKECRARLDPATFGFTATRRRTPGLRREEVAQRAHLSTTWYTWLEQGRGGAPSERALEQIAQALALTDTEREHLFLLAFGHPPQPQYQHVDAVTPRLQRILDAVPHSPAIIKTATWDVVAWNRAAAAVLTDYAQLDRQDRNILRLLFYSPAMCHRQANHQDMARYVVDTFRADVIRAGATREVEDLVAELSQHSDEFKTLWHDAGHVRAPSEGTKIIDHPDAGPIEMEFASFAVNARADLSLMIFNPANPTAAQRIKGLLQDQPQDTEIITSPESQRPMSRHARHHAGRGG